jgi:hypothetical protein
MKKRKEEMNAWFDEEIRRVHQEKAQDQGVMRGGDQLAAASEEHLSPLAARLDRLFLEAEAAGDIPSRAEFLSQIEELCREYGICLVHETDDRDAVRVLLVMACATDAEQLGLGAELDNMRRRVEDEDCTRRVEFVQFTEEHGTCSLENFKRKLTPPLQDQDSVISNSNASEKMGKDQNSRSRHQYDYIQFSGHAYDSAGSAGNLAFCKDDGSGTVGELCDVHQLAKAVDKYHARFPELKGVILNACCTLQQGQALIVDKAGEGTCTSGACKGEFAVVCTACKVSDKVACDYSANLYHYLAKGFDLEQAHQEACETLAMPAAAGAGSGAGTGTVAEVGIAETYLLLKSPASYVPGIAQGSPSISTATSPSISTATSTCRTGGNSDGLERDGFIGAIQERRHDEVLTMLQAQGHSNCNGNGNLTQMRDQKGYNMLQVAAKVKSNGAVLKCLISNGWYARKCNVINMYPPHTHMYTHTHHYHKYHTPSRTPSASSIRT